MKTNYNVLTIDDDPVDQFLINMTYEQSSSWYIIQVALIVRLIRH